MLCRGTGPHTAVHSIDSHTLSHTHTCIHTAHCDVGAKPPQALCTGSDAGHASEVQASSVRVWLKGSPGILPGTAGTSCHIP